MSNVQETINLYHTGYQICLVCSIIFLILTIFLFFRFNIPKIISDKTGRALKKSMKDIEAKNARTGTLRTGSLSGKTKKGGQAMQQQTYAAQQPYAEPQPTYQSQVATPPVSRVTPPPPAAATDILVAGTDLLGASSGMAAVSSGASTLEMTGCGTDTADQVPKKDLPLGFHITKRIILIHSNEII